MNVANCIVPAPQSLASASATPRVTQVFLAPFNEQQTATYVKKFAASKALNLETTWPNEKYTQVLWADSKVTGLAESPLMLFIILIITTKHSWNCKYTIFSKSNRFI
jgi:hypothetical protein